MVNKAQDHVDELLAQWQRERPDLDVAPLGVYGRLFRVVQLSDDELAKGLAQYGLQQGWFDLLAALRRVGAPFELNPTSLMRATLLSSSGMTKRLDRIVDFLLVRLLKFEIPNILRDAAVFTLFFVGVLLILYRRTGLDVTGLFTTAGILSIVIGLALQDTLGNVFSGLAIQTERAFNVGDWVRFGEHEGVVVDVSWRATKLT